MVDVIEGIYDVGTVSIANGSDQLIGTGTFWLATGERFDEVYVAGQRVLVKSIDADGVATLAMPWTEADVEDAPYVWSFRSQLRIDPTMTQAKIRDLITFYKMGGVRGTREITDAAGEIVVDDLNKAVVFNRSGGVAVSIAEAGANGQFVDGWATTLKNSGAGLATITPEDGTINGQPYLELPAGAGAFLWSHGGDYLALVFSNLDGADGASIFVQPAAPGTDYAPGSLWIDSDSAQFDLYTLTGSPLGWADTGLNMRGPAGTNGTNGIDGASALTVVRVVATANVNIASGLENGDAIDGVALATNDLVLLTAQTTAAENGVYVVSASGAAIRAAAFATYDAHAGRYFSVMEGTAKPDTLWRCTSNRGGTLGVTAIVMSEFRTGRDILTANRTYYVRADGNDNNDGLSNTSGGAFATLQKAINTCYLLDLTIFNVTISLTDVLTTGFSLNGPFLGSGVVIIDGNGTGAINLANGTCIVGQNNSYIQIRRLKLSSATGGFGIYCLSGASTIVQDGVEFGTFGSSFEAHVCAATGGKIQFFNNYKISGSCYNHMYCVMGGIITADGVTVTLTGTPAFPGGYVRSYKAGVIEYYGSTFTGTATGPRYSAGANSVIDSGGAGANYFPGSSAGSTATGGLYL